VALAATKKKERKRVVKRMSGPRRQQASSE
jgi:hypothetical protein